MISSGFKELENIGELMIASILYTKSAKISVFSVITFFWNVTVLRFVFFAVQLMYFLFYFLDGYLFEAKTMFFFFTN